MVKNTNTLIYISIFALALSIPNIVQAGTNSWQWSKAHNNYMLGHNHSPYLEHERHVQIPQWSHEDWVAEDWIDQYDDPKDMIAGFYEADIIRDQTIDGERTILVVGPNFYHLSGFDKRRVSHVIDTIYGITKSSPEGAFFLKDWKTSKYIGVHDKHGLRLH